MKWFEEKMGPDVGADMMKLLPPVGWGDIVTKSDLRGEMAELRGEMAGLRGRWTASKRRWTGWPAT